MTFTESLLEQAALTWLESLGWQVAHGPAIAPDMPAAERRDYGEVVLAHRLRDALPRFNPDLPNDALEDAFRKLLCPEGPTLEARNRAFHRMLEDGVTVLRHGRSRDPRRAAADQPGGTLAISRQASGQDEMLSFFHYRDRDDFEVDIVIERGAGAVAGVEVKAAATVTEADFRGLRKLKETAGADFAHGVVLYDGEACIPFGDRLHAVPLRALWGSV